MNDDTRDLETALAQHQVDRQAADRQRQTAARLVGGLVEDRPLIGVPVAALAIWLQRTKDAHGRALDERLVEWQRANALEAVGTAGLSAPGGTLDATGSATATKFLGVTAVSGGMTALDAWQSAPESPRPVAAAPSPAAQLRRMVGGSTGGASRERSGPSL